MDNVLPFGLWLKKRRKALDLTQSALAERVGCSLATIEKIEAEERRPSMQIAELLAEALEIPRAERATFLRVARRLKSSEALTAVAPPVALPHRTNLPIPPTPLVGRQAELDGMYHLLANADCRLISLIGPGGFGKTRLAIEFARRQRELFPDGVYYVALASAPSPDAIVPAFAEAFAFSFSGPVEPKVQLFDHIARCIKQPALLVLDNLEHLLAQSAATVELIAELLERFSNLKVLCTSRERLNLHGEWLFDLNGLPVPPLDAAAELEEYSAALLFLQAARRRNAKFVLNDADKRAVRRICQLLEGIPLALELAAAWTPMLSCQEIAREIEADLDFLAVSMRNLPERHRSLKASFEHSWRLLSDAERTALSRLSVFHGGFDRAAADRVAGATLALLSALVSKSLVRRTTDGRYDLHEAIRQYAMAHLDEEPFRCLETCDLHSAYYLQFAAEREWALKSARQQQVVAELVREMDNLRAAWAWAIEREKFALVAPAVRGLGWFFEVSGLIHEGIEHFEPLVRALKAKPEKPIGQRALGQALTQQGLLCFRKGHFERAQRLLAQGLATLRPLGDPTLLTDALIYLGVIVHLRGDLEYSQVLFEEGLACAQPVAYEWFAAYAIYNLGYIASLRGQYARGRAQMFKGLAIWRRVGDPHSMALGLHYLAPTLVKLGSCDQARAFLQEALELCQQSGNRWGMGTSYRHLGLVEMAQGNLMQAQSFFQRALETFGDYIVGWDIARTLIFLGETFLRAGDLDKAETVLAESLRLSCEIDSTPLMLDAILDLAELRMPREPERAYGWLTLVANHPAALYESRARAVLLRDELSAKHSARKQSAEWTIEMILQDALGVQAKQAGTAG
jgi:predicted ATPase/transcriptional regulator with XRE-family HTH domain/Tfp pilus assembly protein PilF